VFTPSAPFTPPATQSRLAGIGRAEELTSGLASGSAIGAGVGGLAALALLLLLFLLFKKKKQQNELPQELDTECETTTLVEKDEYISEYGLSEGGVQDDSGDDLVDMPQGVGDDGNYISDEGNASEHNPEDGDEFGMNGDET
jgi:hypothetical protein